jgi:hypothetical protein
LFMRTRAKPRGKVVVVSLIIQHTKEKKKNVLVLFPNVATGT